jgi:glutathione synthase/RimK-type ligase-like ATP-grasp enzyme
LADDMQRRALNLNRHYWLKTNPRDPMVRILAIATSGDLTANTPLDFLLQDARFALEFLYLLPAEKLPDIVPDHDVAIVAIAYSSVNAPTLTAIADVLECWPKPIFNLPRHVLKTSRKGVAEMVADIDGVLALPVATYARAQLAGDRDDIAAIAWPAIIRPVDSHAGKNLQKVDRSDELAAYLATTEADVFSVTPFCNYRSGDGLFRKWRVVLIDGQPFIAHMALRDSWMIHYKNAGMAEDPAKRAAEAKAMAEFDDVFAKRHARAFAEIYGRMELDYLTIDCSEMPDGRLLIFEADTAMLVHDMDPPEVYPYKSPHMQKLFAAFREALIARHSSMRNVRATRADR